MPASRTATSTCTSRVYGMTEALHRELQPLRRNVFDVIARLREADVFFALNHLLHFYRGQIPLDATCGCSTRCRRSKCATAPCSPRTICSSSRSRRAPLADDARDGRRQRRAHAAAHRPHLDRGAGPDARGVPAACAPASGGRAAATATHARSSPATPTAWSSRYIAALAGFGPRDLGAGERAGCLAFAAASLPLQFLPWLLAARSKAGERRAVAHIATREASRPRVGFRPRLRHRAYDAGASRSPASASSPRSAPLARTAGGACSPATAASARPRSSTRKAIAAASPPKSTWTRSTRGSTPLQRRRLIAQRSHRRVRRGGSARRFGAARHGGRPRRASACSSAPAPPICSATRISTAPGLPTACIARGRPTSGTIFPARRST